jgi:hypothetical protein
MRKELKTRLTLMRKKSRKSASTPQLKTRHGVFNSDEKRNQENLHQNPNSKPDMCV